MSCWASSRRSLRGLASFCVRVWDGDGFCWLECGEGSGMEAVKTGTACLPRASKGRAPTTKIETTVSLAKLVRFIVRAEDFLRHWRLYLKASWTWMRRSP